MNKNNSKRYKNSQKSAKREQKFNNFKQIPPPIENQHFRTKQLAKINKFVYFYNVMPINIHINLPVTLKKNTQKLTKVNFFLHAQKTPV